MKRKGVVDCIFGLVLLLLVVLEDLSQFLQLRLQQSLRLLCSFPPQSRINLPPQFRMSLWYSFAHVGYLHPDVKLGYFVVAVVELVAGEFEGLGDHLLCGGVVL